MMQPFISVIIPYRPNDDISNPKKSFEEVDYPKNKKEIIFIKGNNPSQQRNKAIKKAKGNILVFVDEDSSFSKNYFSKILKLINKYPNTEIFGGPVLLKENSSVFEKAVQNLMSNFIFSAYAYKRYKSSGKNKKTFGTELILCNMIIKKKTFEKIGYFNEQIYPQEEIELLERAKLKQIRMIRSPTLLIKKPQRKNIYEFSQMLFSYGKMRAKIKKKVHFNIINILPSIFLIYFLVALIIHKFLIFTPLIIYFVLTILGHIKNIKKPTQYFLQIILQLLGHLFYGLGFLTGLFHFNFGK